MDNKPLTPPTADTTAPVISISNNAILSYTVGDSWSDITALEWCSATDDVDGVVACEYATTTNPLVDTSNAGTYIITYLAEDTAGNITLKEIMITVREPEAGSSEVDLYYQSAINKTGLSLYNELSSIIQTGMIKKSYDEARYILNKFDRDPNNHSNVLTMYDRQSVSGVWDNGNTWNREHVWPNSRLGIPRVSGSTRNIGTDLHNLRAADPGVNSSRGNKWFDISGASAYFPGEDDKGDAARILFYMVLMYPGLNIVDVITAAMDVSYTPGITYMAKMSVLMQWHLDDPVDDFERHRNDVIYNYQNNRNPFIDRPLYAIDLWGNNPSQATDSRVFVN